jgi:outer membrane protein assembly factor BamB
LVHAASSDGVLATMRASGGGMKWSKSGLGSIVGAPVVAGGKVIVGSADGILRAYTATSGALAWKRTFGTAISVGTLATSGRLLVFFAGGSILEVSVADGTTVGTASVPASIATTPAVEEGTFYIGRVDGRMSSRPVDFTGSDPTTFWDVDVGTPFGTVTPAAVNGRVIAAAGKRLICFDSIGTILWSVTFNALLSSTSVDGTTVYVGETATGAIPARLHALNVTSGDTVWTQTLGFAATLGEPVSVGDLVIVGGSDRMLRAFTKAGTPVWSAVATASGPVRPIVFDGMVVATTGDGWVRAYALDAGARAIVGAAKMAVPPAVSTLVPDPALVMPR